MNKFSLLFIISFLFFSCNEKKDWTVLLSDNSLDGWHYYNDNGNKFGCPIGKGYNFKDRKFILDNIHNYIGERATFTYFQRTNAGSYRHPLFKTLRNYE